MYFDHSAIITPYFCMCPFISSDGLAANLEPSTIEVMFLSFRRSQHALLALSFFVVMVLVVFSTLL